MKEILKKNSSLVMSIVLAVITAMVVFAAMNAAVPTATVVVAKNALGVGKTISESDLMEVQLPSSAVPKDSFSKIEDVAGKTVAYTLPAGDIVRQIHVTEEGSMTAMLKTFAPKGYVAVELPSSVGKGMQGILRGDRVDIFGPPTVQGQATLIAKDAVVLLTPWYKLTDEDRDAVYVVAVPKEIAPLLASARINNYDLTLVLGGTDNV